MKWTSTILQLPPVGERVLFHTFKPVEYNHHFNHLFLPETFVGFRSIAGNIVRVDRNHIFVDAKTVNWIWTRIELPYETLLLSHSTKR
jgi:hypothetical protein